MEQKKYSSNFIWRSVGITGILSIIGAMYFVMSTYNQVGLNEQEIKAVKTEVTTRIDAEIQGLHAHISTVETRLGKKVSIINELVDQSNQHEIDFYEYIIGQTEKDNQQDLQIQENKLRIEYLK